MDTFLGRFKNLIFSAGHPVRPGDRSGGAGAPPLREGKSVSSACAAISAVTPIETAVVHSQQWVQNIFKNYAYLRGVRGENRDLRSEIEQLKIQQTRMEEDARIARRVQALLGFKEQTSTLRSRPR